MLPYIMVKPTVKLTVGNVGWRDQQWWLSFGATGTSTESDNLVPRVSSGDSPAESAGGSGVEGAVAKVPAPDDFHWQPSSLTLGLAPSEAIARPTVESFEVPPTPPLPPPPPADPWRHRRGEPRVFAFLWTVYMLASVLGSLLWVSRSAALAGSVYAPAARVMLLMIAIGATVLWPMTRLSQEPPQKGIIRGMLADLLIVTLPIQVIVWPMMLLAAWPFQAVVGLALLMLVWPALMGGVVALGQTLIRRAGVSSAFAAIVPGALMILMATAVLAGPLLIGIQRVPTADPGKAMRWLFSPLTHIFRLAGMGLGTPRSALSPIDWSMLGAVGGAAGGLWFLAAFLTRSGRRG